MLFVFERRYNDETDRYDAIPLDLNQWRPAVKPDDPAEIVGYVQITQGQPVSFLETSELVFLETDGFPAPTVVV
jgi:hypothetical protein